MSLPLVLIRGGGDLGSGVAFRLHKAGIPVIISELPAPVCVRRLVCFSEAVYRQRITVEGITGERCHSLAEVHSWLSRGCLPVLVDPSAPIANELHPLVCVDARMRKAAPEFGRDDYPLTIGLGPGFTAGENVHAVVETNRGPRMGRVFWQGSTEADTGIPERVQNYRIERVIRAPGDGILQVIHDIGSRVSVEDPLAQVGEQTVKAAFDGIIRGMLHDGQPVYAGMKIGDLDPRNDPSLCQMISDKALAVGGGVLEAILSRAGIRDQFYGH